MNISLLQQTLDIFCITQKICHYSVLQETAEAENEKHIFLVKTKNDNQYVCRYYKGNQFNSEIINQQSNFAMILKKYGIITPMKYKQNNNYCIPLNFEGKTYLVTVEDYLIGNDFKIDIHLYKKMGELLGNLHSISETHPSTINYSIILDSIMNGRASYENILKKSIYPLEGYKYIANIIHIHDSLVCILKKCWSELPRGSAHGDLSTFNNIINVCGQIGIIDFDLAGNEIYITDLLITFYSSIYKYAPCSENANYNFNEALNEMLNSYLSKRKLSKAEINAFPYIAALFDGLYFSKHLISMANSLQDASILNGFSKVIQHFDASKHQFQTREYI